MEGEVTDVRLRLIDKASGKSAMQYDFRTRDGLRSNLEWRRRHGEDDDALSAAYSVVEVEYVTTSRMHEIASILAPLPKPKPRIVEVAPPIEAPARIKMLLEID